LVKLSKHFNNYKLSRKEKLSKTNIYKELAEIFDERYSNHDYQKIADYFTNQKRMNSVLELGVGTGFWSNFIKNSEKYVGIDISIEMLKKAKRNAINPIRANVEEIPIKNSSFEFVFLVNVIHQIEQKLQTLSEINRILRVNGKLSIIYNDIFDEKNWWYVYKFFPKVVRIDKERYSSQLIIEEMLQKNGFSDIKTINLSVISKTYIGKNVFDDIFLKKHNSTQLANLSDEDYQIGIENMKLQIEKVNEYKFISNIIFKVTEAIKNDRN